MITPSKEECLSSIQPNMKLTRSFLKRIYGYEISYPGFAEEALKRLEDAGCSRARQYYSDWVSEYETEHNAMLKNVAEWYVEQIDKDFEAKQREVRKSRAENIQSLNKNQLTKFYQELLAKGIIKNRAEFTALVKQGY